MQPNSLDTSKPAKTHYMTVFRVNYLNRMLGKLQELLDSHIQMCDEFDWYEENFLSEDTDDSLGFVFVACQVFISGTVGDVIGKHNFTYKEKEKALKNAPKFKGFRTKIELINAAANYYKHKDESEIAGDTLKIMEGFGLLKEDYPLLSARELLIGEQPICILANFLIGWRNHVFNTLLKNEA
jgi:hypothetical protein